MRGAELNRSYTTEIVKLLAFVTDATLSKRPGVCASGARRQRHSAFPCLTPLELLERCNFQQKRSDYR